MHRKLLIYLRSLMFCVCGLISVGVILFLFGGAISKSAVGFVSDGIKIDLLPDIVKSETTINTVSGFEEDFLKYTAAAETEVGAAQNLGAASKTIAQTEGGAVPVNLSALSGKYTEYKGTSVINNTDYDVTNLLYADYELPELNKDDPYILIYHTHTSEGYAGGGTVVDVGKEMAAEFEKLGYKTIHLTEAFDKEEFSGAYSRSIVGVQKMLEKYPSIKLAFDVHRDAITDSSGVEYRPVTTVEDNQTAQVMFVCGTDAKGLKHPNWRENFMFALDVSRTMGSEYGSISRPVNLRGDRFNTHVTEHAFIMEVGSAANTLDEAKSAAVYTARSVIKTIEK